MTHSLLKSVHAPSTRQLVERRQSDSLFATHAGASAVPPKKQFPFPLQSSAELQSASVRGRQSEPTRAHAPADLHSAEARQPSSLRTHSSPWRTHLPCSVHAEDPRQSSSLAVTHLSS